MAAARSRTRIVIIAPVYRDWESADLLCRDLDAACAGLEGVETSLLFVDDGSPDGLAGWASPEPRHLAAVDVLRLRRNVGNQRAIAIALSHVHARVPCDAIVVMDSDGEDKPSDVPRLVRRILEQPDRIVFAERRKRLDGVVFKAGYHGYRALHWILTGVPVKVGNFSVVPASALARLTCMSELWNHYSGAVYKSKLPFDRIPMARGPRYRGRSHMNLIDLVTHGMAGIATYQDVVATRILLATVGAIVTALAVLGGLVVARLGSDVALPGWGGLAIGLLLAILVQLLAISFSLVFILISSRNNLLFVPARDHAVFIDGVGSLFRRAGA